MSTLVLQNVYWFDSIRFQKGTITISNGRIATIQSDAPSSSAPDTLLVGNQKSKRVIDGKGSYLIPSFTEAHMHFSTYVSSLAYTDLSSSSNQRELENTLGTVVSPPDNRWIGFSNFHQNTFEGQLPTLRYLDSLFPENPVLISSFDLHSCILNTPAIEELRNSVVPADTAEYFDKALFQTNGVVYEEAAFAAIGHVNQQLTAQSPLLVAKAVKTLNAQGITAAMSYDGETDLTTLAGWENRPDFTLRIMTSSRDYRFSKADNYALESSGKWTTQRRSEQPSSLKRVEFGPMKVFTDGALGSQTALMSQPYLNSESQGIEVTSQRELTALLQECKQHRMPVAVHSIGDKACDNVLGAFSLNSREYNLKMRNRVEHVQYLRDEHLLRLKEAGLSATTLPVHIPWDFKPSMRLLGKKRTEWIHRLRDINEHNIPFAITSDCPVAPPSPLKGFQWAVSERRTLENLLGKEFKSQVISRLSGLRAITSTPAWLLYGENYWGSIKIGMSGDLVLLSSNPLNSDSPNAPEVILTIFEGKVVFQKQ